MLAVHVQTPAFFFERAVDQLSARFPPDAMIRLEANLRAFRAWVADPAFREPIPDAAVDHVLKAVGPAVQLEAEFIAVLASVPRGMELFIEAVTEDLVDVAPEGGPQELAHAAELLQRAWLRFAVFHPDLAGVEAVVGDDRLGEVLTLGFHADNLLTVVDGAAPQLDEADPFKPTTVADLLALPPYDGPSATPEEMDEPIRTMFKSP